MKLVAHQLMECPMQIASVFNDELEQSFDRIDQNGDRSITFEEFSALLLEMDHAMSEAERRTRFNVMDTDYDGRVNYAEFCDWVVR